MKKNTDLDFYGSNKGFLRSSALKTLDSCSWKYYCEYVLNIPSDSNDGARMGSVCHSIFECLLKPNHRRHYDRIIEADSIKGNYRENSVVLELVWKLMKDYNLPLEDEVYKKIEDMILVGLKTNFFVGDERLIGSEKRFKHVNESPKYSIYGTMDKIVEKGKDTIIIYDWKGSKKKYEGEDKESNIQALFYSLAATKFWPNKKVIVKFVFLQFSEDPIIEISYDLDTLKGFEYYLEYQQKRSNNFTLEEAKSNFASNQVLPKAGEFKGPLSCGYSKFKGHTNKNGKVYWSCPFKWGFDYYIVKEGYNELYSVLNKEDIVLKYNQTIEKKTYSGCPSYIKDNFLD